MADTIFKDNAYSNGSTLFLEIKLAHKPTAQDFEAIHNHIKGLADLFKKYTEQTMQPAMIIKEEQP